MSCPHDSDEMWTATDAGKCPLCQAAEIERQTAWLETIESVTDEEISARFRTGSHKTEEQMAGKSVIYTMLSVPRNLARAALRGAPHTPVSPRGDMSEEQMEDQSAYIDRLERLLNDAANERDRLRAALHEAQEFIRSYPDMPEGVSRWILDVIRAALAGKSHT